MQRGLGTQLRHLIELLDGDVAGEYVRQGLNYRPRYTPVMRALLAGGPLSVTEIAQTAGITQPAATQTIALMVRDGLLATQQSRKDSRRKAVAVSRAGRRMVPDLQACWKATKAAADSLDEDLPFPLSTVLDLAIEALAREPFAARIAGARTAEQQKGRRRVHPKPSTAAAAAATGRRSPR